MRSWQNMRHMADGVAAILGSGVYTQGPQLERLEAVASSRLDGYAVAGVSSGTSGLIVALQAVGVHPGDRVGVPSLAFHAVGLAVLAIGAEPVFVDVDPGSLCMDPTRVPACGLTAVIVVDHDGVPADVAAIRRAAGCPVIEDACPAWGSVDPAGVSCGLRGNVGVFSLNQTKIIGAGEGGLVVSRDESLIAKVRMLANFGETWVGEKAPKVRVAVLEGGNHKLGELPAYIAAEMITSADPLVESAIKAGRRLETGLVSADVSIPGLAGAQICRHKLRLLAQSSTAAGRLRSALQLLDVPVSGDVAPLPTHPVFSGRRDEAFEGEGRTDCRGRSEFREAQRAFERSVIIGDRRRPPWCVGDELDDWIRDIRQARRS